MASQNCGAKTWKQFPPCSPPRAVGGRLQSCQKEKGSTSLECFFVFLTILCLVSRLWGRVSSLPHLTVAHTSGWTWVKSRQGETLSFKSILLPGISKCLSTRCVCHNWGNCFTLEALTFIPERSRRAALCSPTLTRMELKCLAELCCHNSRLLPFHLKKETEKERMRGTLHLNSLFYLQTGSNSIRSADTLGADLSLATTDVLMTHI